MSPRRMLTDLLHAYHTIVAQTTRHLLHVANCRTCAPPRRQPARGTWRTAGRSAAACHSPAPAPYNNKSPPLITGPASHFKRSPLWPVTPQAEAELHTEPRARLAPGLTLVPYRSDAPRCMRSGGLHREARNRFHIAIHHLSGQPASAALAHMTSHLDLGLRLRRPAVSTMQSE